MAEQNFWNNIQNTLENGVNQFVKSEVERYTGPAKTEAAPDASKTVYEKLQAQMASNKTLILVVAVFIIAAVFLTAGGRRGRK